MKKTELKQFLWGVTILIAFVAVGVGAGLAAHFFLEVIGIKTYIALEPYINNEGDEVSSSLTGPGSSSILFGLATALYLVVLWLTPKFKGWLVAACCSTVILILAWPVLVAANYLLDYAFGYEDGWHQGVARLLWLALSATWSIGVYLAIKWVHQFFESANVERQS